MNFKALLLLLALGAILVATLLGVWPAFERYASEITMHGWIALALGTVLSLGLGAGLMALSFYSARRGFDDRVENHLSEEERD
ncbi:MAG: hypothetical protein AB7J28_01250 [Hyphomonadaceae bacterium]